MKFIKLHINSSPVLFNLNNITAIIESEECGCNIYVAGRQAPYEVDEFYFEIERMIGDEYINE